MIDPDTLEPEDNLTGDAIAWCKSVGSDATTLSQILESKDSKIYEGIQAGIDKANEESVSRAQKIQKWKILDKDFTIPGGELGKEGKKIPSTAAIHNFTAWICFKSRYYSITSYNSKDTKIGF